MTLEYATFFERIYESGLLARDELDSISRSLEAPTSASLEAELLRLNKLNQFQIDWIYAGDQRRLVLGQNRLLEEIGQGGMGNVYRAEHQTMRREVAVKVINERALNSERSRKRFMLEVQTAAKLLHPNIVTAHDAGEKDDVPYLVMEYVDGMNLRHYVRSNGPFSFLLAINYLKQAATGLQYAHEQGVIHRDIKPSNLLLDNTECIKILDLGLARYQQPDAESDSEEITKDRHIVGTVEYMSPEQATEGASIDERSDIYSLGCSLYYLLTGKPPFHRSTPVKTLVAHRLDPIPLLRTFNPDIPNLLESVFRKMVAKHPDDRYQTMDEIIGALEQIDCDSEFEVIVNDAVEDESDDETEVMVQAMLAKTGSAANNQHAQLGMVVAQQDRDQQRTDSELIEHAVGIDLGTTYSVIAYLNEGKPVTLANAEGEKITPSVLLFEQSGVVVGKEAVKAMPTDMAMIAECVKRDLGATAFHKKFARRKIRPEILLAYILKKLKTRCRKTDRTYSKCGHYSARIF